MLTPQQLKRYSRHLILPEVGLHGQNRLASASVLVVGAGGLGSPVLMYLAAAGVGRIGIVDYDVVDESNLQRQIIHGTPDVGKPKLQSAVRTLLNINPHLQIDQYEEPLTSHNALSIMQGYELVIDGTDNFPTRYLVNDACVMLGIPNVYGSIFRFEGQLSIFATAEGPCYRCLYPEPPPPGMVPSCAEGGVLGILPGTIGALQATEAIKYLLGIGEPMIGRMLVYDALSMSFSELKIHKKATCKVCGTHPTVTELIDYEQFCSMPAHDRSSFSAGVEPEPVDEMTPHELLQQLGEGRPWFVLDVREPHEWEISNLAHLNAVLIPKDEVLDHLDQIPTDRPVVVYCRSGVRSAAVVRQLQGVGYHQLWNLKGGILRWGKEIDQSMVPY